MGDWLAEARGRLWAPEVPSPGLSYVRVERGKVTRPGPLPLPPAPPQSQEEMTSLRGETKPRGGRRHEEEDDDEEEAAALGVR